MDAVLGLLGILLIIAAVICIIVFGILLIVKAARKKNKKGMAIALGSSAGGLVLGIILFSSGLALTPHDQSVSADNSSTGITSESSTTDNSTSESTKLDRVASPSFSDTTGQQTTKISGAEIKDISSYGETDENGNPVNYAMIIMMAVTNNAPQTATTFPGQGHVVMSDGTQLNASETIMSSADNTFKDGDVANGATVSGYVYVPLTKSQATSFKSGQFKFEVMCGDSNLTTKDYSVPISFQN